LITIISTSYHQLHFWVLDPIIYSGY
jgi:hypothetical protein